MCVLVILKKNGEAELLTVKETADSVMVAMNLEEEQGYGQRFQRKEFIQLTLPTDKPIFINKRYVAFYYDE